MVDSRDWGSLMFTRAAGAEGRRAMVRCVFEYLLAGRLRMLLAFSLPILIFPLLGWVVQAAAQIVPHTDLWEKYGPLGILAGWLMLQQVREERRRDKRDKEFSDSFRAMVEELRHMNGRPCLLELETEDEPPHRHSPRKTKHGD